jgi:DNA-binding protein H-NS
MTEYNNLSEDELQAVIQNAEKALKEKQSIKRKEVILQIKELADSIGVTVDIKDNETSSTRKGKKVAAKYRNPENQNQTWTGRGVKPKWMQLLVNSGHDKADFLI